LAYFATMNVVIEILPPILRPPGGRFLAVFRPFIASISVHSVHLIRFREKNFRKDFFDLEGFRSLRGGAVEKLCRKVLQNGIGLG
jgi:hypothetical protein